MNAKQIEKAYEKRLCKDYELLYDFATKGFNLICCFDSDKVRKVYQVRNDCSFDGMYLAFLDDDGANRKELFIKFCTLNNLTFILP